MVRDKITPYSETLVSCLNLLGRFERNDLKLLGKQMLNIHVDIYMYIQCRCLQFVLKVNTKKI